MELAHCGSLLGQFGANSYTTGVLSQTGRTLSMKGANVKVFDQVTAVAFPGSSGGGVYLKNSGEYVGMLTQGVMQMQGFNFIVPVRRIHAFAKAAKIEWALDPSVPLPKLTEIENLPVEDAATPTPAASAWNWRLARRRAASISAACEAGWTCSPSDRPAMSRTARRNAGRPVSLVSHSLLGRTVTMRLRPAKVEKIKAAIASGMKQSEIAKKFKTSRSNVSDIATGRVHKDVAWPEGEPPVPKPAGGQHKPVPGYDPTDQGSWSWRPRSSI